MPAPPFKDKLKAAIGALAREFEAPDFAPHVTIYHGQSNDEEASVLVRKIATQFSPLDLEARTLEQSERYSKTFFIQFAESETLRQMFEAARDGLAMPASYVLDPHLSLLYRNVDETQRQALCRRALVPVGKYFFDSVCAIAFEPPWSDKAAREYRVIIERKLREGQRQKLA